MIPEGIVTSVFPRVQKRLNDVGVFFDPWQQGAGTVALGCRKDGKFAAGVGGACGSIPRQVGKTFFVSRLELGLCLEFPEWKCAWTSHHNRTTTNTFRSVQGLVRRKQIAPFLAPNGIRTTNGEQEIRFINGSIMMFGAREQGFGRGLDELDSEVFDEAQILTLKALEDMVPATNQARNPHGGLLFFIGTPPRPSDPGEAFTAKREQALSGKSKNIFWFGFSADPESKPDDVSQYPIMNPSFPHRTPMEAMERMRENIPDDDSWNREARGIWPKAGMDVIDFKQWTDLGDPSAPPPDRVVLVVAVAQDRSWSCIAVAGDVLVGDEKRTLVMCQSLPGLAGVAEKVAGFKKGKNVAEVALIGAMAKALAPDFTQAGIEFETLTGADEAASCAAFQEAVKSAGLVHLKQVQLDKAVKNAQTRMSGESERWDRKDVKVDDSPLVAVSGAFYRWGLQAAPVEVWEPLWT
ncbi:terminase [Mycobacterium sp. SMC-13]|uniref:terminase n=1 Tax=Mycobacterium sp. SMC-13 TaxID=3381626 RepID=UPI00387751BF